MTPLKYTRQQLADALQLYVAMDKTGEWWAHENKPILGNTEWQVQRESEVYLLDLFQITTAPADWRESLTSPRTKQQKRNNDYGS